MRLIDADALIKTIDSHCYPVQHDMTSIEPGMTRIGILQTIQEQPTVEPERKKGKWTNRWVQNGDQLREVRECSECRAVYLRFYDTVGGFDCVPPKYCPNCGADLRGEK